MVQHFISQMSLCMKMFFCSQLQRPAAPCGSTVPSKLKTQGPTASQSHQGAVGFETADLYQVQHLDLASHVTHLTHTRKVAQSPERSEISSAEPSTNFQLHQAFLSVSSGSKYQVRAPECLRNKIAKSAWNGLIRLSTIRGRYRKLCWLTVPVAHGLGAMSLPCIMDLQLPRHVLELAFRLPGRALELTNSATNRRGSTFHTLCILC